MDYMDYPLRALIQERNKQFQGLNDNVMIDTRFQLKIVDLGLARQITSYNDRSVYVTTRFYRAPEVVLFTTYEHKVDVWSIGCIFAELLTGSILCPGRDKCDQWTKIVNVVGSPDESFISKLDEQLQAHVRSMPMKEPLNFEVLFSDEVFPKNDQPFCNAKNGRDLLSRMLVIDPDLRISAAEALKIPYVSWKSHMDELSSPPRGHYDARMENVSFSIDEWKRVIFERIKDYEQNQ
uniref:Protein kinase domain-containing protein n=1 Tax=Acrobeloides nanus TaxID=290746 RepID=A0A914D9H7_9BILA